MTLSQNDDQVAARILAEGLRQGGELACAGGVHVFSPALGVAAPGAIATHPRWRGHGFARAVAARLCQVLRAEVEHIGLNVKADNPSAVACYEGLSFERVAVYEECWLTRVAGDGN